MAEKISPADLAQELARLEGWAVAEGRDAIVKDYRFANFSQAFAWMTQIAMVAEKMDHHPEWTNVYSRIGVVLTTHDKNGVTKNDIEMAQKMDKLAKLYNQS